MIALRPPPAAKSSEPIDPKEPGKPIFPPGKLPNSAEPNFAAWVTKALAALPVSATDAKAAGSGEKADTKSNSSSDKPKDAKDADGTGTGIVPLNVTGEVAPPPPPPPLQLIPASKTAGHTAAHAKTAAEHVSSASANGRNAPVAQDAAAKLPAERHSVIQPAPPEGAAKLPTEATKAAGKMDGMAVAQNEERMKFGAEQNKIAGQATQKLPPVGAISSAAAVKADANPAKTTLPVDFSQKDNNAEQISLTASKFTATTAAVSTATATAVKGPTPVHRVEEMIAREAVSFKQSGANEVGVSLKIDAHTQLFLQLSYRDGQTQAVLRCEKGDLPALSAHFGQLQESLARQNIQLQSANDGSDLGRQDSTGRQWRESTQKQEPLTSEETKTVSSTKPKTKPVSQRGWETWA